MPAKKVQSSKFKVKSEKPVVKKVATRTNAFSIPVYSLVGREAGSLSLPKEVFGAKVNKNLLAQALRVYLTNQKTFTASTKTRGEVRGSTRKVYKQKGTGGARHGSIRAPIYVGGGIVFGPRPRKVRLDLPKKMKKAALISALSDKMSEEKIVGLSGLEKATGKTTQMAKVVSSVVSRKFPEGKFNSKSTLIVTGEKIDNVVRGVRNIPGVDVLPVDLINAYEVIRHQSLIVTKEAVERLKGKASK